MMKTDPFAVKQYPKWHPIRLTFTARARLTEREARLNFKRYLLPDKVIENLPDCPNADYSNTAVTPKQMQYLLSGLLATESYHDTVVVEIGCYRGVTTQVLAQNTARQVIAIDPYIGYGGCEQDYEHFKMNTNNLSNVIHEKNTSGAAFRNWKYNEVSFVFIDAVHDYVNTVFDVESWSSLLVKGGILAMHDTDQLCFAGTRKAVFETLFDQTNFELFAHTDNLTLIQKIT